MIHSITRSPLSGRRARDFWAHRISTDVREGLPPSGVEAPKALIPRRCAAFPHMKTCDCLRFRRELRRQKRSLALPASSYDRSGLLFIRRRRTGHERRKSPVNSLAVGLYSLLQLCIGFFERRLHDDRLSLAHDEPLQLGNLQGG